MYRRRESPERHQIVEQMVETQHVEKRKRERRMTARDVSAYLPGEKTLLAASMIALITAALVLGAGTSRPSGVTGPGNAGQIGRPDALICLDPGHGGKDAGARGGGVEEKDANLDVALRARALLELAGYRVIMTRSTDVYLSLARRCSAADKAGADVFVSVHNNAKPPDTDGTTTYYARGSAGSWRLAAFVQRAVVMSIGRPDRGLKTRNLYVLRNTRMPAALLEGVFLTDPGEARLVQEAWFRQRMAEGIALGIDLYLRNR